MANNRMWLVHKATKQSILLAKYYPSTGWYAFHTQERYDEFFERCNSRERGAYGDTEYELRFESKGVELTGEEIFSFNKALPDAD